MSVINTYKHHTEALVEVDEKGVKTIIYAGRTFKSFKDVISYKQSEKPKQTSFKEIKEHYARAKGDF
ncbi:hypothetical protein AOC36_09980 [Erysipelothrix larvae]|uniref:Uncharacterized protein n=1 Tax=Erysipelothrix larvae TaxID=1514105 RepID=A0A109UHH9_9FIRM|nr:hypothetical protein [Erysipelothrix larvae]AMC94288.1 hypothetical protein AOC36_09980 [Erysipelothrix larvae]